MVSEWVGDICLVMGCCFRDVWWCCCRCELSMCVNVESPAGCALFCLIFVISDVLSVCDSI